MPALQQTLGLGKGWGQEGGRLSNRTVASLLPLRSPEFPSVLGHLGSALPPGGIPDSSATTPALMGMRASLAPVRWEVTLPSKDPVLVWSSKGDLTRLVLSGLNRV